MNVLAYGFEHLIARVSDKVFRLGQVLLIRLEQKLSAVRGDNSSGVEERRTWDHALSDGSAHAGAGVIPLVAHVADRGEAGLEHCTGIDHTLDGPERVGIVEGRVVIIPRVTS